MNYLDVGVKRTCADKVAIGMEVYGSDVGFMAGEGTHYLGGLQIPYLEGTAL